MRRLGFIGGLFWMAVGLVFALMGVQLNVGTLSDPGPGFLPVVMAMLLVFLSLFNLLKGVIKAERSVKSIYWRRHALIIASVFVYGLLLGFVGFLFSTFVLMFILFGLLAKGEHKWGRVFCYAAVTALAAWAVFSVALGVPFPLLRLRASWM